MSKLGTRALRGAVYEPTEDATKGTKIQGPVREAREQGCIGEQSYKGHRVRRLAPHFLPLNLRPPPAAFFF